MSQNPYHQGLIRRFQHHQPEIAADAFIAPTATVIGDVKIGAESSIWFGAVLRGDVHAIRIGERTSIQDNSVIHITHDICPTIVGNDVTVGHAVTLHSCTVEDFCIVGMGSVVLDRAVVGRETIVGAGSVVSPGTVIPPGHLVVGVPARVKRPLTATEFAWLRESAKHYVELRRSYLDVE